MGSIYSTPVRIAVAILDLVFNIANLFLGNIVVYETSTKIKFDWMALFQSRVFWCLVIIHAVYEVLGHTLKHKELEVDRKVEAALDDSIVDLIKAATDAVKNGDYDTSKRVQKALKKIYRRRKK